MTSERGGLNLRTLRSTSGGDHLALKSVLDSAPSYWRKISGRMPSENAAKETLEALPEGKTYEDKFVLGIDLDGELVGCVDVVRGFPSADTAMLGLLLLNEAHQGRGIGKTAYQALENLVRSWPGVRRMRIGVVGTNEGVLPFWRSLGFKETGQRKPYQDGSVKSETLILEKRFD